MSTLFTHFNLTNTAITQRGQGYCDAPGLYDSEQPDGWKRVLESAHAVHGKIVVQLWHVGRVSAKVTVPLVTLAVRRATRITNHFERNHHAFNPVERKAQAPIPAHQGQRARTRPKRAHSRGNRCTHREQGACATTRARVDAPLRSFVMKPGSAAWGTSGVSSVVDKITISY